jgi:ankyrin repeat/BTB/POZ domain-containing protein 1
MDIYCAARAGDLARVKYLCEVEDVDLNKKNDFDSIPLFYACLCGHKDIVLYLLDRGAKLDSNTFEGERCYYAALTDEIENILRTYKAKATINPLTEKLKNAFKSGSFSDITFQFKEHTESFSLHKFILSVKCTYFTKMFKGKWNHKAQVMFANPLVTPEAFSALVEYLYTNAFNIAVEHVENLMRLCDQCELPDLRQIVHTEYDDATTRKTIGRIIIDRNIYASPENFATSANLAYDLWSSVRHLYDATLRLSTSSETEGDNTQEVVIGLARSLFTDSYLVIGGIRFYVHRVLLCAQSEYFRSMLSGGFRESTLAGEVGGEIEIADVAPETFYYVLEYVYTNFVQNLEQDMILDLLLVADQLLIQNLKNLCARQIIRFVDCSNVIEFLQVSDLYNSVRLREYCEELIEQNLDALMDSEDLKEYLNGDGASVPLLKEKIKDKMDP